MALDSSNVRVGVTGGIYVADIGTTLPTDATTALSTVAPGAYSELGFADESGIQEQQNEQVNNIRAWQRGEVVRKIQQEHDVTWLLTAIETNPVVLEQYYGNFTGTAEDGEVRIRGGFPDRKVWIIDVLDGDNALRIVIPEAQVTTRGTVTYANGAAVGYPMTVTGYPSDEISADKAVIYMQGDDGS